MPKIYLLVLLILFFLACSKEDFPLYYTYSEIDTSQKGYYVYLGGDNYEPINGEGSSLYQSNSDLNELLLELFEVPGSFKFDKLDLVNETQLRLLFQNTQPVTSIYANYELDDNYIIIEDSELILEKLESEVHFYLQITNAVTTNKDSISSPIKYISTIQEAKSTSSIEILNQLNEQYSYKIGDTLSVFIPKLIYDLQ